MAKSPFDTPFDQLPNPKQDWLGKPGSYEEGLGKLAILTPEVVAAASASEIRCGRRVTMGWEMTKLDFPNLNRQPCHHQIVPLLGGVAFDDIYTMNPRELREILLFSLLFTFLQYIDRLTEQSSQWDGLRHFSQTVTGQSERVFYGGTTSEEINDRQNDRIGLQHWAREGIAGTHPLHMNPLLPSNTIAIGRGVLIDYATWAEKKGIKYTTFSTHQVRFTDILEIAKESNIKFQKGDILFVRIGVTKEWDTSMTDTQKQAYSDNPSPEHAGVEATTEVLRWLWDTGFAAIASDAISWEVSDKKNRPQNSRKSIKESN